MNTIATTPGIVITVIITIVAIIILLSCVASWVQAASAPALFEPYTWIRCAKVFQTFAACAMHAVYGLPASSGALHKEGARTLAALLLGQGLTHSKKAAKVYV